MSAVGRAVADSDEGAGMSLAVLTGVTVPVVPPFEIDWLPTGMLRSRFMAVGSGRHIGIACAGVGIAAALAGAALTQVIVNTARAAMERVRAHRSAELVNVSPSPCEGDHHLGLSGTAKAAELPAATPNERRTQSCLSLHTLTLFAAPERLGHRDCQRAIAACGGLVGCLAAGALQRKRGGVITGARASRLPSCSS